MVTQVQVVNTSPRHSSKTLDPNDDNDGNDDKLLIKAVMALLCVDDKPMRRRNRK